MAELPPTRVSAMPPTERTVLDGLIDGAWSQLTLVVEGGDSHVNRGFATLAANLAVIALVFAKTDKWTLWWVVPIVLAAAATALLWVGVRHREVRLGPDINVFWQDYGNAPLRDAQLELLARLQADIRANRAIVPTRARLQRYAEWLIAAEIVTGAVILACVNTGVIT